MAKGIDGGGFVYPYKHGHEVVGITRRDWLAGLAMQGLVSIGHEDTTVGAGTVAKWAYELADAMIAEGKK